MSENTNDVAHMHDILHSLFGSPDFKCKEAPDPPGSLYAALKVYLSTHLTSTSFSTFWKCICQMEAFMLKAFCRMNVLSALKLAGLDGDKINTRTIMEHNREFVQIHPIEKADEILGLIDTVFSAYWWNHGLIHEEIFTAVFEDDIDIDTLDVPRVGKPLNDLPTNRQ